MCMHPLSKVMVSRGYSFSFHESCTVVRAVSVVMRWMWWVKGLIIGDHGVGRHFHCELHRFYCACVTHRCDERWSSTTITHIDWSWALSVSVLAHKLTTMIHICNISQIHTLKQARMRLQLSTVSKLPKSMPPWKESTAWARSVIHGSWNQISFLKS